MTGDPRPTATEETLQTLSALGRRRSDDAIARHVLEEARKGRVISEILEDAYVRNRATRGALQALLDRNDLVGALGRDATDAIRAHLTRMR
jgi:hypothetical protein